MFMMHDRPRSPFTTCLCATVAMSSAAVGAQAGPPSLSDEQFLPGDDAISVTIQDQEDVSIAAGGDRSLMVWTDERAVLSGNVNAPGDHLAGNLVDIYGQLIEADGQPIGGPIVISSQGRSQDKPDLAWNESAQAWLVAYESDQPDWYFNENIYAVRVSLDGVVLDEEPLLLMEEAFGQGAYQPDVASNGTDWLVIADQWYGDPTERTVRARRVNGDGTLPESSAFTLMQSNSLFYADVAYANGVYLVVADRSSGGQVWGQRFDDDLNPIGGLFQIGAGNGTADAATARIASNGARFLVVGRHAYRVEPDGTVLDPGGIDLAGAAIAYYLDCAWTGENWAVSMAIGTSSISTRVQRIADDGTIVDPSPIFVEDVTTNWTQDRTAIAGLNGEMVITYPRRTGAPSAVSTSIRSAHVDVSGVVSNLQTVTIGLPRQSHVQLINGPGELLAVFMSRINGEYRVMSQRLTLDGTPIDTEPTVVHSAPFISGEPRAAWNGSVYLVTWNSSTDDLVLAKRVAADNTVIDTGALIVANNAPGGDRYSAGAVSAAGDTFVVGIFRYAPFNEPLRYVEFVRVRGTDGKTLDATPVFISGGFAREMTGASFTSDDRGMLAWAQYNTHDSPSAYTQAVIVSPNGSHTGSFAVSQSGRGKEPDIAIGPDRALVVWHDDLTIHQDNIEGRFVFPDGSMPSAEFPISTAINEQMFPAAGFDGEQFVVAWNDYRHIDGIEQERSDVRAARITLDGTMLDPNSFAVTEGILPEDLPAVGGGNGSAVIMYSRLHGLNAVPEIQRLRTACSVNPASSRRSPVSACRSDRT